MFFDVSYGLLDAKVKSLLAEIYAFSRSNGKNMNGAPPVSAPISAKNDRTFKWLKNLFFNLLMQMLDPSHKHLLLLLAVLLLLAPVTCFVRNPVVGGNRAPIDTVATPGVAAIALQGELAVARDLDDRMIVFARSTGDSLYYIKQATADPASPWQDTWTPLGGPVCGNLAVIKNHLDSLAVFSTDSLDRLVRIGSYSVENGRNQWSGWHTIGPETVLNSKIAVARNADRSLVVFGRAAADNCLHYIAQSAPPAPVWDAAWTRMEPTPVGDLIAVGLLPGRYIPYFADSGLQVFVNSTDDTSRLLSLWQQNKNGNWTPEYQNLGGVVFRNLAVGVNRNGNLDVFTSDDKTTTTIRTMHLLLQPGTASGWSEWEQFIEGPNGGGYLASGSFSDGRLAIMFWGYRIGMTWSCQVAPDSSWIAPVRINSLTGDNMNNCIAMERYADGRLGVFAYAYGKIKYAYQSAAGVQGWSAFQEISN
jgi:hypothetical protein